MQKTVSAREANQRFSSILAEVDAGHEVIVTRRGKPVARIVPFARKELTPERRAAIERMRALMKEGADLGGLKINRDELYDRG